MNWWLIILVESENSSEGDRLETEDLYNYGKTKQHK